MLCRLLRYTISCVDVVIAPSRADRQWFPASSLPLVWDSRARPSSRTLLRYLERLSASGRTKPNGEPILSAAAIHRIEEDVLRSLRAHGLALDRLLMDTTNFFTYHEDGGLHRKGHSKERRYD